MPEAERNSRSFFSFFLIQTFDDCRAKILFKFTCLFPFLFSTVKRCEVSHIILSPSQMRFRWSFSVSFCCCAYFSHFIVIAVWTMCLFRTVSHHSIIYQKFLIMNNIWWSLFLLVSLALETLLIYVLFQRPFIPFDHLLLRIAFVNGTGDIFLI